jgi:hypothetical protein
MLLRHVWRVDKNHGLGASLRDVLVLQLLAIAEAVDFIEMSAALERLRVAVRRSDNSETTTSDVSESAVEAIEVSSVREENSEWDFLLVGTIELFWKKHDAGIDADGESISVVVVEIGFQSSLHHLQHSLESISGLFALKSGGGRERVRRHKKKRSLLSDAF